MVRIAENVAPCPLDSHNVRVGDAVSGEGGCLVPISTETKDGQFLASLMLLEPGCRQVVFLEPPWTCPDIALGAAEKIATGVAA